jgi:hypothetical protein
MTTAALLALLTLAPARADGLTLTKVRLTQGILGPTRDDASFQPGDAVFVAFDLDNVAMDGEGRVRYSTALEVIDSKNKVIFHQPAKERSAVNSLGGHRLPAFAQVDVGLQSPPGDYSVKVTVNDLISKTSQSLTQKFTVLPRGFGLVRVNVTTDPEGQLPPAVLGVGQAIFVNAVAVDFGRDAAKKQPNLRIEMRILDDKNKPVLSKPFVGVVDKDVPANASSAPVQFLLSLNRAGKFTVELKATDATSRKPAIVQTYPITVLAQ